MTTTSRSELQNPADRGPGLSMYRPLELATNVFAHERSSVADPNLSELNHRVSAAGFEPPGAEIAAWRRLARIVEIEPTGLTPAEICDAALIWRERQLLRQRIVALESPPSSSNENKSDGVRKSWGFVGSRDWENWGIGLDADGLWHLFHFNRNGAGWIQHQHAALRIPAGMPHDLGSRFVSNRGLLALDAAHAVWKRHAKRACRRAMTLKAIKPPMSRLRRAIREALEKEGHSPDGMPVSAYRGESWQAHIKFGYAVRREGRRGLAFACHY